MSYRAFNTGRVLARLHEMSLAESRPNEVTRQSLYSLHKNRPSIPWAPVMRIVGVAEVSIILLFLKFVDVEIAFQ